MKMRTDYCRDCKYWNPEYQYYIHCPMLLTKKDELCFNKKLNLSFAEALTLHECTSCSALDCPDRINSPKEMYEIIIACSDYKFKGDE